MKFEDTFDDCDSEMTTATMTTVITNTNDNVEQNSIDGKHDDKNTE